MIEKCEISSRSRNYEGLSSLSGEVKKIALPIIGKHGLMQIELMSHWNEILGNELAYGIKPLCIKFNAKERSHGTLKVQTAGGAFALLFEHRKNQVLERINAYFGYPAISQIKMEQGTIKINTMNFKESDWPLSESEIEELTKKISNISDEHLRQEILDIGIKLIQKNKST